MRVSRSDPVVPARSRVHVGPPTCPHRGMSRRSFLGTAAGATGFVLGSSLVGGQAALAGGSTARPRPIPGGVRPFGPGTELFHLFLPAKGAEPSTITDFEGDVGLALIRGEGTATNTKTGKKSRLVYEVDQRFMKGHYIALDGHRHESAFGFI